MPTLFVLAFYALVTGPLSVLHLDSAQHGWCNQQPRMPLTCMTACRLD